MAAKQKTVPEEGMESSADYGMAKTVLILLLLLDLAAGGVYIYFQLFKLGDLEKALKRGERGLIAVHQQTKDLGAVASTIWRQKLAKIDDPGGLIMEIAAGYKLQGKVTAEKNVASRWKATNYEEVTVRINFIQKEGYYFGDIITFLQAIEHKNPKLLIREMNFGKREMAFGTDKSDTWRPTGGALTVRTFRLKN